MIADITTIVWKELKEMLFQRGNFKGGWAGLLVFVAVFGILMPLQTGREWVESPLNLLYWAWVPFILVAGMIADSFAGERERHTLETLLASRLSDRAILFGKIAASIAYGWGFTLCCILVGLISVNLVYWNGHLLLYPLENLASILGLSLLVAGLATGIGIQVSLRAATVRQASQTFSLVYFVFFVPLFLIPLLPEEWKLRLVTAMTQIDFPAIIAAVISALVVLNLLLFVAGMARFRRSRLILD